MTGWNGFSNLDLSDAELDDFAPLGLGEHEVRCTDVEIKSLPANGRRLILSLDATDGSGNIKAGLNIVHSSKMAQEIARSQLKTFLTAGGHPDPDHPGDLDTLKGLICRIYVGEGKPYTNSDGKTVQYNEVKRFLLPDEVAPTHHASGASSGGGATKTGISGDEIPFMREWRG